ncbi:MAG: hypothetical protein KDB22_05535 [Planctomycetales bacterium]|nr:hypothetical protein [Planctomycetales bacterium]
MNVTNKRTSCLPWVIIPFGCLAVVVISCSGLLFFTTAGVMQFIKSSEPYQHSLLLVKNNEKVKQKLGEPINSAFLVTGSVHTEGTAGDADLTYSVSGPTGKANVNVRATRSDSRWKYLSVRVNFANEAGDFLELAERSNTPVEGTDKQ